MLLNYNKTDFKGKLVAFDDNCFFLDNNADSYYIEKNQIDTPNKVVEWVQQLSCKNWFTILHLEELINLIEKHTGVKREEYNKNESFIFSVADINKRFIFAASTR